MNFYFTLLPEKLFFRVLPFTILLTSMTISCARVQGHEKIIIEFVKNDKDFSESDYKQLVDRLSSSKDKSLDIFKENGKVSPEKIKIEIERIAKSHDLILSNIWQPGKKQKPSKFNFNVYVENSLSMEGYVEGKTSFELDIKNFLVNVRVNDKIKDKLNLSYINSEINSIKDDVKSDEELDNFIENLEPDNFTKTQGDGTTTDISKILKKVINSVDDKNVGVLVSDFVFSPKKGQEINVYLENQLIGIKGTLMEKFKKFDLSIAIFHLESEFAGKYFDKFDNPHRLANVKRPYYVWVIGNGDQIKAMHENDLLSFNNKYKNKWIFESINTGNPEFFNNGTGNIYSINPKTNAGNFSQSGLSNFELKNAEAGRQNEFKFSVYANYRKGFQDPIFFNSQNVKLDNPRYSVVIDTIKDFDLKKKYTHELKFSSTDKLRNDTIKLNVNLYKTPSWVSKTSSNDDLNIEIDSSELQKTFGLSYLLDGTKQAFEKAFKDAGAKSHYNLQILVKVKESSNNWIYIVSVLVILLVTTIIGIIRKKRK